MRSWKCRDCKRTYDFDVDKCPACGSDDWMRVAKKKVIKKDLIGITAAARMLKRSAQTLRNWEKTGKIRSVRIGRIRAYKKADVMKAKALWT